VADGHEHDEENATAADLPEGGHPPDEHVEIAAALDAAEAALDEVAATLARMG